MQKRELCVQYVRKNLKIYTRKKHQKHAHTPTLEQLTAHIAHTQNKQKQLEYTHQDLHKQNKTLSIQMLHQQKTVRD